ncbi:MAG: DUF362 domain-containing protein [Candidatus Aminicenantes bacterium]|nr:DUF362 domain-containing protein [Candidatus Aminicenantes bacterium]
MKSRVYFVPARREDGPESLSAKARTVLRATGFPEALEASDFTALKIHFGEKGNTGHIKPAWLKGVADEIGAKAPRLFLTDTNTLYVGSRSNSIEHIRLAWDHGFRPEVLDVPVIIADGLIGHDSREEKGSAGRVASGKLASAILGADAMLALSHVTGHVQTGIGAAIKNLGMGCASRAGKLDQHAVAHPRVLAKACRDCGLCYDHCAASAIVRTTEGRARIDDALCVGCGECLVVCKHGAVKPRWDEDVRRVQEKVAEYALLVRRHFGPKLACLNYLLQVTKDCDCMAKNQSGIVEDIGICASLDPVAIDRASADLVLKRTPGRDPFRQGYDVDWSFQMSHGQSIGLGSTDYDLIERT